MSKDSIVGRIDLEKVREFEETKQGIMQLSEQRFHVALLQDDIHDMKKLFEVMLSWIGTSSIGLLHTFAEESQFCSAAQKSLLAAQKRLFLELHDQLLRAVAKIEESRFDAEKVDHAHVLPPIQVTIERIMLNSAEIIAVPGKRSGRKVA